MNEKMMPDVTVMVPELEMLQWTNVVEQQTSRSCAHKPPNYYFVLRNSWVQVPKWRFLKRLLARTTTTTITTATIYVRSK